jgi:hypothetical protein
MYTEEEEEIKSSIDIFVFAFPRKLPLRTIITWTESGRLELSSLGSTKSSIYYVAKYST